MRYNDPGRLSAFQGRGETIGQPAEETGSSGTGFEGEWAADELVGQSQCLSWTAWTAFVTAVLSGSDEEVLALGDALIAASTLHEEMVRQQPRYATLANARHQRQARPTPPQEAAPGGDVSGGATAGPPKP